jgi:hypothetical protein
MPLDDVQLSAQRCPSNSLAQASAEAVLAWSDAREDAESAAGAAGGVTFPSPCNAIAIAAAATIANMIANPPESHAVQ